MWLIPVRVMEDVRHAAVENGVTTSQLVTKRDNYTCQVCGKTTGRLAAYHILLRRDGGQDSMNNLVTVCSGICHKKIEPRKKFTLFLTRGTYQRIRNLVGNVGNDEVMMIRLCEELE